MRTMRFHHFLLSVLFGFSTLASGFAQLIGQPSEFGPTSITRDTNTNLEWLDLDQTVNSPYNEIVERLADDQDPFSGFRYASVSEVATLFESARIPMLGPTNENDVPAQRLVKLLGATRSETGNNPEFRAISGTPFVGGTVAMARVGETPMGYVADPFHIPVSTEFKSTDLGHFLVRESQSRDVDIDFSVPLDGIGIASVGVKQFENGFIGLADDADFWAAEIPIGLETFNLELIPGPGIFEIEYPRPGSSITLDEPCDEGPGDNLLLRFDATNLTGINPDLPRFSADFYLGGELGSSFEFPPGELLPDSFSMRFGPVANAPNSGFQFFGNTFVIEDPPFELPPGGVHRSCDLDSWSESFVDDGNATQLKVDCDFDNNGRFDIADVELLAKAIASRINGELETPENDPCTLISKCNFHELTDDNDDSDEQLTAADFATFLNRKWFEDDGTTPRFDHNELLQVITEFIADSIEREIVVGDSDLNGRFDSGDLVAMFAANEYESGDGASILEGDWNGDGKFDSSDIVAMCRFQLGVGDSGNRQILIRFFPITAINHFSSRLMARSTKFSPSSS